MRGVGLFVACAAGMGVGLVLDTRHVEPAALASLCSGAADFGTRLQSHWRLMPATHWSMVAVALLSMMVRLVRSPRLTHLQRAAGSLRESLCLVAMSWGMARAMDYGPLVSTHSRLEPFAAMVVSMLIGMASGAALASSSLRAVDHVVYRLDGPAVPRPRVRWRLPSG